MHDILRLMLHTGPVAKGVLIILFILSVLAWAVILREMARFIQINRVSEKFLQGYRQKKSWADFYQSSRAFTRSPFANVFMKGLQEYHFIRKQTGMNDATPLSPAEVRTSVTEVTEIAIQEELGNLEQHLPILATTVSISPFLGLFGTVWGVMEAFIRIGLNGSSDIGTVGPGIAEALITTVAGLFVAIPALAAYNLFIAELKKLENKLILFARDFIGAVERKQNP